MKKLTFAALLLIFLSVCLWQCDKTEYLVPTISQEQFSTGKKNNFDTSIVVGYVAAAACPIGYTSVICGGVKQCLPPGGICCNGNVYSNLYKCLPCGPVLKNGGACCGSTPYNTKAQICLPCGGQTYVVGKGSFCCNGRIKNPGQKCP